MEKGKLYGIGVGPGDPELMTLKAVARAKACHVLALPRKEADKCFAYRIALASAPELAAKEILEVDMPMTKDANRLEQAYREGARQIAEVLEQGKTVGFLTLGDPTVYSTYLYLHQRVAALGYGAEIIPGVTSFCAAAAELGISLCENKEQLHILPGTYSPTEGLCYPGTKVLMKNNLPATLAALRESGQNAFLVENATLPNQKIYTNPDRFPEDAGYYSVVIVKDGNGSFLKDCPMG